MAHAIRAILLASAIAALVRWEAPETFDPETSAEIKASRLMTPYWALAMAVQNEERAFGFWSYLAAFAQDAEIKRAAEAMAREELGPVSTLRKQPRRTYHLEHGRTDAYGLARVAPWQVDARRLELRLAAHLADAECCLQGAAAARARELLDETMEMADRAGSFGSFSGALERRNAEVIAEALPDAYLEGAERSDDAERVQILQRLAERAILKLA
jgi:rubrerythrin